MTLFDRATANFKQITTQQYRFNHKKEDEQMLMRLTLADCQEMFRSVFKENKRRFEVHILSHVRAEESKAKRIERVKNGAKHAVTAKYFSRRMSLYPDFYSHSV